MNRALVFRQLPLLSKYDRTTFSPALNTYLPESKLMTTVGSVSEDAVHRTEEYQIMLL